MSEVLQCRACGTRHGSDAATRGLCPRCLFDLGIDPEPTVVIGDPTPGAQAEPEALAPGRILGDRYEILELLGRGGMGEVWRAADLKLRVEVALKALRREFVADARRRDLLRREVRSAREVVSPNVCRVFDLVTEGGHELVSMEHVDGRTLGRVLRERSPLGSREAAEVAIQLLDGLEAIHQAGLVHRDLKPDNVMITRCGRVVVMDLGVARGLAGRRIGTIAGTPAYMAPEQARGEPVDARADVYAAGVLLSEMIDPAGVREDRRRQVLIEALREDPPRVPNGPWKSVLERALAWQPAERYPSARALARALEEVTLRSGDLEGRSPYPGLAPFAEADAAYFFGREPEVEALWRTLRRPRLRALIGVSGAGKSSFLHAGVLPARPDGWGCIVCTPGDRPFVSLGQALASELAGDAEAVRELPRIDESDVAVSIARRWRRRHGDALLVIDQFEELFTLNPDDVQARFANLLGRLALEADVHVLLSMRDDFLLRCHSHESLHPIFHEITPLQPPSGGALRRALVQPALLSGYRFEDDALLDDMLREVAEERGALPLLAFSAAALWERRDRERGLLTRRAYDEIGGVAGALGRHAEKTLERIGSAQVEVVRELFRNLVTAQGTRAIVETEELLSIFEKRDQAASVLQQLIDARLLTSFDRGGEGVEGPHGPRVELIHESLVKAWPRLVRWRSQDAEQAQLRDQLRQAAHTWKARGRPTDLLWSGTSFREFSLWRERYPGGLTRTEAAFAQAMESHALRRQRLRRLAVASAMTFLAGVLAVVSFLWRQSQRAERSALAEARRAEASKLFAFAQLERDDHPTAALAYAIASLELADSREAREFAVDTLWRGPTAFVLGSNEDASQWRSHFSPDGNWLLQHSDGSPRLWRSDGSEPRWLDSNPLHYAGGMFSTDSQRLLTVDRESIRIWSLPAVEAVRRIERDGSARTVFYYGDHLLEWIDLERRDDGPERRLARGWPLSGGEPETLGVFEFPPRGPGGWERFPALADLRGRRILIAAKGGLHALALTGETPASPRLILPTSDTIRRFTIDHPSGGLVTDHVSGTLRTWSRSADGTGFEALGVFAGDPQAPPTSVDLDPQGRWLSTAKGWSQTVELWDLHAPAGTQPLILRRGEVTRFHNADFHPSGRWVATSDTFAQSIWPLSRDYPRVVGISDDEFRSVAFDPGGEWLAAVSTSASGGGLWIWPLSPSAEPGREVLRSPCGFVGLAVSPSGDHIVVGSRCGEVFLLPSSGSPATQLAKLAGNVILGLAFDRDGQRIAFGLRIPKVAVSLRNLQGEELQVLHLEGGSPVGGIDFVSGGQLLVSRVSGLYLIDLGTGESELLVERGMGELSPDSRFVVGIRTRSGQLPIGRPFVYDLEQRVSWELEAHGEQVLRPGWDPGSERVVTPSRDGTIRVGPRSGEEPHRLSGHERVVSDVAVDPSGRWIASAGTDGTVRLWPMPRGRPLHTLEYDDLLDRLRSLTNYRIVQGDERGSNGYRLEFETFRGWNREPPTW